MTRPGRPGPAWAMEELRPATASGTGSSPAVISSARPSARWPRPLRSPSAQAAARRCADRCARRRAARPRRLGTGAGRLARRHRLAAADLGQQRLGLRRRHRVQHVGEHRPAPVVRLDRHPPLAALGMRPHQRAPGALVRPVDRQQLLGHRDQRLGRHLLVQQRLRDAARTVPQPLALAVQPDVERRVDAVQLLEQLAVEQRERARGGTSSPAAPLRRPPRPPRAGAPGCRG